MKDYNHLTSFNITSAKLGSLNFNSGRNKSSTTKKLSHTKSNTEFAYPKH